MNNIAILPLFIPLLAGVIMFIFRKKIVFQKILSVLVFLALIVVSIVLIYRVDSQGIQVLHVGGWEAPFGISMVIDMFSALLVLTSSIVSLFVVMYAFRNIGKERENHYFYPLFILLIAGVNLSFITGDLFNLFVAFEIMLIASYVLITLGGSKNQLKESVKYIVINLTSSFLFLIAVAYLYSMLGTLNMAHLSVRVAEAGQPGLVTAAAILLLVVFSIKAGLFLFFWLPGSYSVPPTAIGAIFAALLTKVGIYSIIRMFSLIFYHEPQITHLLIGILGAITMILGAMGAVGHNEIGKILAYNVIISVGFIIAGLAMFSETSLSGSIYYLIHDIIVKALLFLIGGTVIYITGTGKIKEISGLIRNHPFLGWSFFIVTLSLAGIPPLSGFIGKVLITKGTFEGGYFWLGAIGLISSILVLYSLMKIFSNCFWGETLLSKEMEKGTTKGLLFPIGALTALTFLLGLGAEGISPFVQQAAHTLMNPDIYIDAVLNTVTK